VTDDDGPWLEPGEAEVKLLLFAPSNLDASFPEHLAAALATGAAAAFVLPEAGADAELVFAACREACARHGVAFLLAGEAARVATRPADGVHLESVGEAAAARERLGPERIVGASCGVSRHAAMVAGEAGADYVMFGAVDEAPADVEQLSDLAAWWSELFVVPCAVGGRLTPTIARSLARAGADFLAVGGSLWEHPAGPAAAARELLEAVQDATTSGARGA
jgi:thiamine-phosphate pyrophosphorylase